MIIKINKSSEINWCPITYSEMIINNIISLLKTKQGEVPFMRQMGVNPDYIDKTSNYQAQLHNDILELISKYESNIKVTDIKFLNSDNEGIEIEVIIDEQ